MVQTGRDLWRSSNTKAGLPRSAWPGSCPNGFWTFSKMDITNLCCENIMRKKGQPLYPESLPWALTGCRRWFHSSLRWCPRDHHCYSFPTMTLPASCIVLTLLYFPVFSLNWSVFKQQKATAGLVSSLNQWKIYFRRDMGGLQPSFLLQAGLISKLRPLPLKSLRTEIP